MAIKSLSISNGIVKFTYEGDGIKVSFTGPVSEVMGSSVPDEVAEKKPRVKKGEANGSLTPDSSDLE